MFFYEIYESEDDSSLGVTLAHDERIPPEDFLAAVEEARGRIIESYTEETLVEAIAGPMDADERERDPDIHDAEDLLAGREPRAMRSAVVALDRSEDEAS